MTEACCGPAEEDSHVVTMAREKEAKLSMKNKPTNLGIFVWRSMRECRIELLIFYLRLI
jgi:hypothetical protein